MHKKGYIPTDPNIYAMLSIANFNTQPQTIDEMLDAINNPERASIGWMTDDEIELEFLYKLQELGLVIRACDLPGHVCGSHCFNCSYTFFPVL